MLFYSLQFIVFFLIVHQIFWIIPNTYRKHWLLISSIVFYGWWSIPFLFHFLIVTAVSYAFIRILLKKRSKPVFIAAIVLNLGNLFFFKYTNSFLTYLHDWAGQQWALSLKADLGIFLPLAISFYTFQIIAFIVDIWKGNVKEVSFLRFNVFILFFPQLIAGPIMRHHDFLYQMDRPELDETSNRDGISLFLQGIVKKVLIADQVAYYINPVWNNPSAYDSVTLLSAAIGFSIQVYGDFSGYTDMARGAARLLGYKIPENFYFPFMATSFAGLWRQWHVTLASWLRDYLYFPLGGSRVSPYRVYVNLIIVMALGGLWHGDTYTFFLWGLVHGIFLAVERALGLSEDAGHILTAVPRWAIVMLGWLIGVVFFRSADMETVSNFFVGLVENSGDRIENLSQLYSLVIVTMILQLLQKYFSRIRPYMERASGVFIPVAAVLVFYLVVRIERPAETFIYFQF